MSWYRTGTVSVTNGSTTVTGSGTDWISGVGVGEAFYGPDGRVYEIASVVSATSMTLGSAYLGTTQSGQAYVIIPSQSYIRDLAADAAALVQNYASVATNAGTGKFGDGTLATPGIRFTSDENTGIRRTTTDTLAVVTGGADRVTVNTSGASITGTLTVSGVTTLNGNTVIGDASADTLTIAPNAVTWSNNPTHSGNHIYSGNLTVQGNTTIGNATTDTLTVTATVQPGVVISGSSAGDALRITQTGAGNALVVEDSANPDSTPFVIDASGRIVVGHTATLPSGEQWPAQVVGSGSTGVGAARFSADTSGPVLSLMKSRNATVGAWGGAAVSGDLLGQIIFSGDDGAARVQGASINAVVDGTSGANEMPGRLVFSTRAAGGSFLAERYRINNAGTHFFGNTTTNTNSTLMVVNGEISETTNSVQYKLVNQSDIGTGPNEIPLNQYLGTLAYQDADNVAIGNLNFFGVGRRITGDMSNATQGDNLAFQTSTTNGNTTLRILPNGTGNAVALTLATDATQAGGSTLSFFCGTSLNESRITSGINGGGTYLPITFYTGAAERLRIDSSGNQVQTQPAPAAVNATATLTVANLRTRIITSTTAALVTATLPLGTDMDTSLYNAAVDMGFDWSVINTGPSNFVVAGNGGGHTVVGNMTVATNASGLFRSRRTAANTWITYRVA